MSQHLHKDEWLKEAQSIPIGRKMRVYHGAEATAALEVRNLDDRWSAYCHRCHKGGHVMKDVVKLAKTAHIADKESYYVFEKLTDDLHDKVTVFLQTKGMCLDYLPLGFMTLGHHDGKRLMFHTPDQVIGRDLTGFHKAKWLSYSQVKTYIRMRDTHFWDKTIILTEDFFSAAKAQYANREFHNTLAVSMCGTVIRPDLLAELLRAKRVVLMLDGDYAGQVGASRASKTLKMLGVRHYQKLPPVNKDPKDMSLGWLSVELGEPCQ